MVSMLMKYATDPETLKCEVLKILSSKYHEVTPNRRKMVKVIG